MKENNTALSTANIRLYTEDVYLKEADAKVLEIRKDEDGLHLLLDRCLFFPTGGGQSCDRGFIDNFPVADVYEDGTNVWCKIVPSAAAETAEASSQGDLLSQFAPGASVHCRLDWEHRFDNMQRHCGEHILSGMFYREYGGINRGFHMGEEYMTIDISLEEKPEFTEITWDMAMHVEDCANEAIWTDQPVITRRFATKAEAEKLPLRKKLTIEEDISIVCVGSIENAADCVACCGTHPSSAGQVGLIKILKVENYKGMFRIYCEAGRRALRDYDKKHEVLTKLDKKYSAVTDTLLEKIAAADEKAQAIKNQLYVLKQAYIAEKVAEITSDLSNMSSGGSSCGNGVVSQLGDKILLKEYAGLAVDDLLTIGRPFTEKGSTLLDGKLLLVIEPTSNTLLLFTGAGKGNPIDCGRLVKENASIYSGKGGGRNTNARAIFPSRENLDTFVDLLEKHLR